MIYPKENAELYRRITQNGAVVSEYLPSSSVQGFHFPERNRLLSAFSKAVIIVESDESGGSMRTAEHLLRPDPINTRLSMKWSWIRAEHSTAYITDFSDSRIL